MTSVTSAVPSLLAAALIAATPAAAAIPVTIGPIGSQPSCTTYLTGAGSSTLFATPFGVGATDSWRTSLVRDCQRQFTMLRASMAAALAGTGRFQVGAAGGGYHITGDISAIDIEATPTAGAPPERATVTMALRLADAAGHIVYGGLLTKTAAVDPANGVIAYDRLEQQVALAAARQIAFRLSPLTAIRRDGRDIRLNYGAPLLEVGTMLQAHGIDGSNARFVVVATDGASALAEPEGDTSTISPGIVVSVVEPEATTANARRLRRGVLP